MRIKKKLVALFLVSILVLSSFGFVNAEEDSDAGPSRPIIAEPIDVVL